MRIRAVVASILIAGATAHADDVVFMTPVPLDPSAIGDTGLDRGPTVATDGAGSWLVAWESRNELIAGADNTSDVVYVRSTDDGATWTPAAPLTTGSGGFFREPTMAMAGSTAIVFWHGGGLAYARSADGGATFSPPTALGYGVGNGGAQIATDGGGTWVVVFPDIDTGKLNNIAAITSTDDGLTWSLPVLLDATNALPPCDGGGAFFTDASPDVATDGSGAWVAVWYSNCSLGGTIGFDSDPVFSRSLDAGLTWSVPAPVELDASTDPSDFTDNQDGPPQIAADAGTWLVTWRDGDVARSTDGGSTWSAPLPGISPRGAATPLGSGRWLLGTGDAFIVSTDDGVTWSPETPVSPHDGIAMYVGSAAGAGGTLLAVAASFETLSALGMSGSAQLGDDADVLLARGATCGDGLLGPGETCEDGNTTPGDGCDDRCRVEACWVCTAPPSVCTIGPRAGCSQPSEARLKIRQPASGRPLVSWKWLHGAALEPTDVGDVYGTQPMGLCVFDESGAPTLALALRPPAAATCGLPFAESPCWQGPGDPLGAKQIRYKDRARAADGVDTIKIVPRPAGQSKIIVKAVGDQIPHATLPLGLPVRVQLQGANGACWESSFVAARASTGEKFVAAQ